YSFITINNSIIWGNVDANDDVVANSIQGANAITLTGSNSSKNLIQGDNGNSNIEDIPVDLVVADIFVDPSAGNYRLKENSIAIDKGDNSKNSTTLDLDNKGRVSGDFIDLGPYEYQVDGGTPPPPGSVVYVKHDAAGSGDGSDWTNAYTGLQEAISAAAGGTQIWVAAGIYKPTANTTERTATFTLKDDVEIYGGF